MFSFCNLIADDKKAWAYVQGWIRCNQGLAEVMTRYVWSGISWKNGYRKQDNFGRADYCVLDFDDGLTLQEAINDLFCDVNYIIGTTRSHQKEKKGVTCDRFRVVVPFSTPIYDLDQYRATMKKYVSMYDSDPACVDGARFFYPCKEIVATQVLTRNDNFEPVPHSEIVPQQRYVHYGKKLPQWILDILNSPDPLQYSKSNSRSELIYRVSAGLAGCGILNTGMIFEMIMKSNIPAGVADPRTGKRKTPKAEKEVYRVIANGVKRGRQEFTRN